MEPTPQSGGTVVHDFDVLAKELAFLLANSTLDDEAQKTIIESLPHLELETLVELVSILEAKYTADETRDFDVATELQLEKIVQGYETREQISNTELIRKLEDLADSI